MPLWMLHAIAVIAMLVLLFVVLVGDRIGVRAQHPGELGPFLISLLILAFAAVKAGRVGWRAIRYGR